MAHAASYAFADTTFSVRGGNCGIPRLVPFRFRFMLAVFSGLSALWSGAVWRRVSGVQRVVKFSRSATRRAGFIVQAHLYTLIQGTLWSANYCIHYKSNLSLNPACIYCT